MLTESQLAQVNASVQAVVDALSGLKATIHDLTPIDLLAEVKAAHAAGKVIQWKHQSYLDKEDNWRDASTPGWFPYNEYRIKPWSLPNPPQGREWHRLDFDEEMLPEGYRPLLLGETGSGEIFFAGEWSELGPNQIGTPTTKTHAHCRTTRPLPPLPDPERERFPLEASDVPPGSAMKRSDDSSWSLVGVCMKFAVELLDSSGPFNMTYQDLKDEGFQILRPGQTEWGPCSKPSRS